MRRIAVCWIGLLLAIAAADARAVDEFAVPPERPKLGVVKPYIPIPAPASPSTSGDTPAAAAVLPDLHGKTCDQARAELRRLHVELTECRPGQTRIRYPTGTINSQSPPPGTPASRADGVRVTYEPGRAADEAPTSNPTPRPLPTQVPSATDGRNAAIAAAAALAAAAIANANARVLPDLRGKTCGQARAELQKLRIAPATCLPGDAGGAYPVGTINSQSQPPGTPASKVDGLRVWIEPSPPAPRPEPMAVLPDVRGMTCDQARAAVSALHIALTECLPGAARRLYPAGTINAQSYAPGTPASRIDGLRVRLEPAIAQPPRPEPEPRLALPDLRGKTCDEAARELAQLRLGYASCAEGDAVAGFRPGRINAQSPGAGTALPLTGPLVLSLQPPPKVFVPALIGMAEGQAASALSSRKLRPHASGPEAAKGRRVLSQRPAAGTAVAPGSAVEIGLGLTVPRLLDLDCAMARDRAAEYGHVQFDCESRPATSPNESLGRVFEQAPPADAAATAAPVPIRVAVWAAQPVTVPDVLERALNEAIGTIEAARLVARPDERQGERIVAQQSPVPGTVVDAGSEVTLQTREVVEVPDVVGKPLVAAQATVQQSRLRDAADAQDHADDRVVQTQSPAAHARVAAASVVQLTTKRFATVPDLGGRTCDEARSAVAPDTFRLTCNDERSWRVTVFGTPHVVTQQPGARARAEVGAMIAADARAPLPAAAPWLGNVPLAAVAGVVVAPILGLGLWLAWPRPMPAPVTPPISPAVVPPITLPVRLPIVPPLVPPPRAPAFEWRVDADDAPAVNLRWPAAAQAAGRRLRHPPPELTWRVVPDAGDVLLREHDVSSGGDHAER